MNIFGFKIGKKHIIIIGVIVALIFIVSTVSKQKEDKELEARRQAVLEEQQAQQQQTTDSSTTLSKAELQQQSFIEEWGQPPEGFRWNNKGDLVAVSAESLTNEEVLWNYLRALSILDFSTVEKYSYISMVDSTYLSYFSDSSVGNASYYKQFVRKAYKFALTTIEIDSVGNVAVFSDGTCVATVKLKVLDLTDKDFWKEDEEEIYQTLRSYYETEDDSAKAEQYIYDYIYSAYENGKVAKRDVTVEIKLDKVNLGGWLISDDTDLDMILRYDKGVNVATYIQDCYADWYKEVSKSEAQAITQSQRVENSESVEDSSENSENVVDNSESE